MLKVKKPVSCGSGTDVCYVHEKNKKKSKIPRGVNGDKLSRWENGKGNFIVFATTWIFPFSPARNSSYKLEKKTENQQAFNGSP